MGSKNANWDEVIEMDKDRIRQTPTGKVSAFSANADERAQLTRLAEKIMRVVVEENTAHGISAGVAVMLANSMAQTLVKWADLAIEQRQPQPSSALGCSKAAAAFLLTILADFKINPMQMAIELAGENLEELQRLVAASTTEQSIEPKK